MNVLFVNRLSFDYLGGVESHILNLGSELMRIGHSVTLVFDQKTQKRAAPARCENVPMIGVEGLPGLRRFFEDHGAEYDIMHGHMSRKVFVLQAFRLAKKAGLPTVFTPHCFYPAHSFLGKLARALYDATFTRATLASCDIVISLTPGDQKDVLGFGLQRCKSRIIPNSIALDKFQRATDADFRTKFSVSRPYLLHIGRFEAQKRIDLLVTWHQDVPADLDLVLIGQDDGELERIRTQVSTLGLTKRIHILPSLPADDVIASYAQAEMLVMASRNEGLPTVILEAMAKDVPVVVPNVGGIPFIVKSGVSGWIYPGGNREGYLEGVRMATQNRAAWTRVAAQDLYENFSWERNAQKVLAEYQSLLQRTPLHAIKSAPPIESNPGS